MGPILLEVTLWNGFDVHLHPMGTLYTKSLQ
jgi:hypothetical protein